TLRVTGPAGLESVHALATASPINLQLSGLRSSSFSNINVFKSEISRRIQALSPGLSWGWDAVSFQVGNAAPPPSNRPPVARFTFSPASPQVNQVVTFNGSSSFDPDGFITSWHWVFQGNGRTELDSVRPRVRFTSARTYQVTLTVTDNQGATGSVTRLLRVINPAPTNQPPVARFTFSPANPQINQIVSFNGSSSSDPGGSIVQYRWDFNSDGRVDATGVRAQARFTRVADFRVTLTVIDNSGRSGETTQTLRVRSAGVPPPAPSPTPSSGQAGFFLFSQDRDKFHLIVRGDPSWTSPHTFKALITLNGDLSGNITVKTTGNATPQTTHYAVPTTLTGKVGNGSIEYVIPIRNPGLRFTFDLQMDMSGNGKLQTGTEVPIFFVIGGRNHKVAKNPFFITRTNQSLLPFGSFLLCTSISATRVRCNPFPG
ncbi:MAG TPA: PKD domain-containing protein, partial [Candidatus Fraserbacteria bacterium]|nr:PKD domain-containing protein [Candidatus Fraserbacteria bacterium]